MDDPCPATAEKRTHRQKSAGLNSHQHSFVVAHEGCGRRAQESGDEGSGTGKHGNDRRGLKIDRAGGP